MRWVRQKGAQRWIDGIGPRTGEPCLVNISDALGDLQNSLDQSLGRAIAGLMFDPQRTQHICRVVSRDLVHDFLLPQPILAQGGLIAPQNCDFFDRCIRVRRWRERDVLEGKGPRGAG